MPWLALLIGGVGCSWSRAFPGDERALELSATSVSAPVLAEIQVPATVRNTGDVAMAPALTVVAGSGLVLRSESTITLDTLAPRAEAVVVVVVETGTQTGPLSISVSGPALQEDAVLLVDVLADFDGDGAEAEAVGGEDCDDLDPDLGPDVAEQWYDGVDQDCDGNDSDADADGWDLAEDCDDTDPGVAPDMAEVWYDGVDQDCDGNDEDADGDGVFAVEAGGMDCDDADPDTFPGALDPDDGVDQDCDGIPDDDSLRSGSLVVTELQVRAASEGPWVELWNPGPMDRPLAGLDLSSDASAVVLPADAPVVPAGGAVVVCGDPDAADLAGLACDLELVPWIWVTDPDTTDILRVRGGPRAVDAVRWNGAWPLEAAASTQLDLGVIEGEDPSTDNDTLAAWCPSLVSWGAGLGSPGAENADCGGTL